MATHYLEARGRIHYQTANIVADIMRHFHARQHLGKAVVVCDDPAAMLIMAHKQWLKLSRVLQKRRASETNAVEILKYTYTITQMQHALLVAGPVQDQPEAQMYFVRPDDLSLMPANCFSLYLAGTADERQVGRLIGELPAAGLFIDYTGRLEYGDFGLRAKAELETKALEAWLAVEEIFAHQEIEVARLTRPYETTEAMDDAIDALLGVDTSFIGVAMAFQRALDLARPLRNIGKVQRQEFEAVMLLAHRVQTLMPGRFTAQFLGTYADDTFFFHDRWLEAEPLAELVARHEAAGRRRLARALAALAAAPANELRMPAGVA